MEIIYQPIGIIHSPFKSLDSMPIQPASETSAPGTVEIYPPFKEGLMDLDGFSHVILLYHLHAVRKYTLTVTPFLDTEPRGVFATRAPTRPNSIGLSVVNLVKIDLNKIHVDKLDVLDGTPLLDIKPYIPEFDLKTDISIGWLEKAKGKVKPAVSDSRFR